MNLNLKKLQKLKHLQVRLVKTCQINKMIKNYFEFKIFPYPQLKSEWEIFFD